MTQIDQLEIELAKGLDRLRAALATSSEKGHSSEGPLKAKVSSLENDKSRLLEELVAVRSKRDRDVAALDDLISQLKPLIEEA